MSSENKSKRKLESLQEENWRLKYQLDENIKAKFENEDRYLSHCRNEAAKERLKKTLHKQELGNRRIDRQLSHVEAELNRLSACLETLREHARHDGQEYTEAMNQALDLLAVQDRAKKTTTGSSQG